MEAHSSKFIFLAASYFDISKMQQDAGLLLLLFTLLFLSFAIAGSGGIFFFVVQRHPSIKNKKP